MIVAKILSWALVICALLIIIMVAKAMFKTDPQHAKAQHPASGKNDPIKIDLEGKDPKGLTEEDIKQMAALYFKLSDIRKMNRSHEKKAEPVEEHKNDETNEKDDEDYTVIPFGG